MELNLILVQSALFFIFLSTRASGQLVEEEAVPFNKDRIITILRIGANDVNASISDEALSSSVFGNDTSVKTQFKLCTETIQMYANINPDEANQGVLNITYSKNITDEDVMTIIEDVRAEAQNMVPADEGYDHLMFCFPKGTTYQNEKDWKAFVIDEDSSRLESYFNADYCDQIGLQMKMIAQNNPFNLKPHNDSIGLVSR